MNAYKISKDYLQKLYFKDNLRILLSPCKTDRKEKAFIEINV